MLFAIAALAQAVWGALVLARPSARLVAAGVAGNVAIIAAGAVADGGAAGRPRRRDARPVAVLDAVASVLETGASSCRRAPRGQPVRPAVRGQTTGRFALAAAVVVVAITARPSRRTAKAITTQRPHTSTDTTPHHR